jgi:hypothetical protein
MIPLFLKFYILAIVLGFLWAFCCQQVTPTFSWLYSTRDWVYYTLAMISLIGIFICAITGTILMLPA